MTAIPTPQRFPKAYTFSGILLKMPNGGMSDEDFFQFCQLNPELRIERNAYKFIEIMPPTSSETGNKNAKLLIKIGVWNELQELGVIFDSSTGFKLPNGATRSPDIAWIVKERWNALPSSERNRFASIMPDFVLELRSEEQSITQLKEKMEEYIDYGTRLGWLVDPQARKTWVYAENGDIQTIPFDETLSGGTILPGLQLRLADFL